MNSIKGSELPKKLQEEVLRGYIYRVTYENARRNPNNVRLCVSSHKRTAVLCSDKTWLDTHYFVVTKAGGLDKRIGYTQPFPF